MIGGVLKKWGRRPSILFALERNVAHKHELLNFGIGLRSGLADVRHPVPGEVVVPPDVATVGLGLALPDFEHSEKALLHARLVLDEHGGAGLLEPVDELDDPLGTVEGALILLARNLLEDSEPRIDFLDVNVVGLAKRHHLVLERKVGRHLLVDTHVGREHGVEVRAGNGVEEAIDLVHEHVLRELGEDGHGGCFGW